MLAKKYISILYVSYVYNSNDLLPFHLNFRIKTFFGKFSFICSFESSAINRRIDECMDEHNWQSSRLASNINCTKCNMHQSASNIFSQGY